MQRALLHSLAQYSCFPVTSCMISWFPLCHCLPLLLWWTLYCLKCPVGRPNFLLPLNHSLSLIKCWAAFSCSSPSADSWLFVAVVTWRHFAVCGLPNCLLSAELHCVEFLLFVYSSHHVCLPPYYRCVHHLDVEVMAPGSTVWLRCSGQCSAGKTSDWTIHVDVNLACATYLSSVADDGFPLIVVASLSRVMGPATLHALFGNGLTNAMQSSRWCFDFKFPRSQSGWVSVGCAGTTNPQNKHIPDHRVQRMSKRYGLTCFRYCTEKIFTPF